MTTHEPLVTEEKVDQDAVRRRLTTEARRLAQLRQARQAQDEARDSQQGDERYAELPKHGPSGIR
ncbi:hypothetical protein ABZW18_00260 [Streptomyces sp. NPDC004647]|uniref:hypothetical protein n=1 Tax=Streptomyces sp. NPDC004647 TaxID=3154671 RepID=UPI0033A2F504